MAGTTDHRDRLRRRNRAMLLGAATACAAGLAIAPARAGLTYDLRFSDGSHTKAPVSPTTYSLDLWARVSGTDSTVTDEALAFSYIEIISVETNGGAMSSGGLISTSLAAGFNEAGSRPGAPADLNGDGISDWGSTATAAANTNYMLARNATATTGVFAGGTLGQAINANTWEFKLATFTLQVGSLGTGATGFYVVQPNMKAISGAFTYASARVDGSPFTVTSASPGTAYTGSIGAVIQSPYFAPPPATLTFDGSVSGTGNQWLTATNWSVDPATSTEHVPTQYDIAQFGTLGTASVIGIDMGGATNGAASQNVYRIVLPTDANRDITIENSSSTTDGTLLIGFIEGYGAVINLSTDRTLTIQKTGSSGKKLMLAHTGVLEVKIPNPGASIVIASDCTTTNFGEIDKSGLGHLVVSGVWPHADLYLYAGHATVTSTGALADDLVIVNPGATLDVAGTLGSNIELRVDGTATLSSPSQTVGALNGAGTLNLAGTALTASRGSFSGSLTGSGSLTTGTLTLSGAASYTGATIVNTAGTLVLTRSHRSSASLTMHDSAQVKLTARSSPGAKTLQVGTLSMAPTATLDLADNDLVVDNGSYSDIKAKVLAGFTSTIGAITSSTSNGTQILALFDNALVGAGQWNGGAIAPNAVVGKYTYFGDANIDGRVTGDDYTVIDANLNATPAIGLEWLSGDMNMDGIVTGDDYTVIDANLGLGSGNPLSADALVSVPEPAGATGMSVLAMLAVRVRRKRRP